jgi:hypothetical protein
MIAMRKLSHLIFAIPCHPLCNSPLFKIPVINTVLESEYGSLSNYVAILLLNRASKRILLALPNEGSLPKF